MWWWWWVGGWWRRRRLAIEFFFSTKYFIQEYPYILQNHPKIYGMGQTTPLPCRQCPQIINFSYVLASLTLIAQLCNQWSGLKLKCPDSCCCCCCSCCKILAKSSQTPQNLCRPLKTFTWVSLRYRLLPRRLC